LGGVRDEDDIGCRTSSISARVPCAPRASTPCARCHSASHASPPTVPTSPRCSRSRGARISRASPVRSSRVAREDNARKTNSATHANDTSALRFRPHIRRAWRVPRPMCPAASIATRGSPTRHPAPRALGEPGFRGSHPRTPRSRRRLILSDGPPDSRPPVRSAGRHSPPVRQSPSRAVPARRCHSRYVVRGDGSDRPGPRGVAGVARRAARARPRAPPPRASPRGLELGRRRRSRDSRRRLGFRRFRGFDAA